MKHFFISFSALIIFFTLYNIFIATPAAKKEKLLAEYEQCKEINSRSSGFEWLRQCDNTKPLSKECKVILDEDYPWELYHQYNAYIDGYRSEEITEGFSKYSEFTSKVSDCSCKTLPKKTADIVNNSLKEDNEICLQELEIKSRILL